MIATVAVLDLVASATEVAVTETCAGLGTAGGAKYSPLEVTEPQAAPLQPMPATLHDTAVFVVPLTVAENCLLLPMTTWTATGSMLTDIVSLMLTVALPDLVLSATEIAVTLTWFGVGALLGAVYRPLVDMVPHVAPVQPLPATLHDTAVFVVSVTVAVSC